MPDNTQVGLPVGSGVIFACAELSVSGDTALVQMIGNGILSGSEGSWVYSQFVGGAGAVAAGVQRVTLASDDPAVALLTTIDADTSRITACDTGAVVVASGAITATLAAETTKVIGTVNLSAAQTLATVTNVGTLATITNVVHVDDNSGALTVDNGGTFAVQAACVLGAETTKVIGTVNVAASQTIAVTNTGTFATQSVCAGVAAEDAAVSGNPVLVAGRYDTTPRVNEDGDVSTLAATAEGHLFTAAQACNYVYDANTRCQIKNAMVVTSTDGATLIAAVASKKFRIHALSVIATSSTVTNFWMEDADGADVWGDSTGIPVIVTGATGSAGVVLNFNPGGWFTTATANKNLVIKLTAAQKVVVTLTYSEVA
jgi:hypothetical protein